MPNEFDPFACPVGIALWEEYRRAHPEVPETPPVVPQWAPQIERDATAYWQHVNTCDDCNEV